MSRIAYLSAHISGTVKLDYLLRKGLHIDAVISITPELAERYGVAGYVDPGEIARRHAIPVRYAAQFALQDPADLAYFERERFDLLVISGWQRLVPAGILATFRCGAIAEHGSAEYLPKGRGRSPVGWALATGQRRFVLHIFRAEPNVDGGPIIDLCTFELNEHDTIRSVYCKIGLASGQLLLANLDHILDGTVRFRTQRDEEASYTRRRTEEDDRLDWGRTTAQLYDHIRATTAPYPMARASLRGKPMLVRDAVPFDRFLEFFDASVGEILACFPDGSFAVKTVDGSLLVRDFDYPDPVEPGWRFD